MPIEQERKYLIRTSLLPNEVLNGKRERIVQGYLTSSGPIEIRVRIVGPLDPYTESDLINGAVRSFYTIKTDTSDPAIRNEWEYEIPVDDARQILNHAPYAVTKIRHYIMHRYSLWELDKLEGENMGLWLAECNTDGSDLPRWVGQDVTGRKEYKNASLARRPVTLWVGMPRIECLSDELGTVILAEHRRLHDGTSLYCKTQCIYGPGTLLSYLGFELDQVYRWIKAYGGLPVRVQCDRIYV